LLLVIAVGCTLGGVARAQVIVEPAAPPFPDPKKFARGLFASGEIGAMVYVGKMGKYADPGVAFGVRIGYDFWRWLAVQVHVVGASSDASLPPPTVGQSFQTYIYAAEARFSAQIRRFSLFAEGGGGAANLSNNILDQVRVSDGKRVSFAIVGGGGIDYHTLNRHFSFGLGADYVWLINFTGAHAISVDGYLRYTR
jgi:hypothetical protein